MASKKTKTSNDGRSPFTDSFCTNLDDMTLESFRLWSAPALKVFLAARKKSVEGSFEELAARAFIAWEDQVAVNPSEEHALRANLAEYKSRLTVGPNILPDPFTLKEGWQNEQGRENWPSVYFVDIAAYLKMTTPAELYHRLCNEYKQGKAYRYFTSGWAKEVHYHPIADDKPVAFLAARVKPSMHSGAHHEAWICVEKDTENKPGGQIYTAYCTCTAGLKGCCNHVAGILFRVEHAVRTGLTRPSSTSQKSVWPVPSGDAPSQPIILSKEVWTKDQYFKKSDGHHSKSVKNLATVFSPLTKRQEDYVKHDKVKDDLAEIVRHHAPASCFLQLYEKRPFPSKPKVVCPPSPKQVVARLGHPLSPAELANALSLNPQQIVDLQKATLGQADCDEWLEQRRGRITASNFHRVHTRMTTLRKKSSADPSPLIQTLMGDSFQPVTIAIKHGKSMEPHAKRAYHSLKASSHKKFKSEDCGLFVLQKYSFIGASPDLITSCTCCGKGICEIKCPESIKDQIPSPSNWTHLVDRDSSVTLSTSSPYYTQIQGQMAVLGVASCDFFVYTAKGYHFQKIDFDQQYWESVKTNLVDFWMEYLAKELIFGSLSDTAVNKSSILDHSYTSQENGNKPSTSSYTSSISKKGPLSKPKLPNVYLCGKCGQNLQEKPEYEKDESIECSQCLIWFHTHCVQLDDTSSVLGNVIWMCSKCKLQSNKP